MAACEAPGKAVPKSPTPLHGAGPRAASPQTCAALMRCPTPAAPSWPSAWQKAGKGMKTKARCQAQLASLQSLLVHISAHKSLLEMTAPKKTCEQAWCKLQIRVLPALSEHASMLCQGLLQAARPVFPVCPPSKLAKGYGSTHDPMARSWRLWPGAGTQNNSFPWCSLLAQGVQLLLSRLGPLRGKKQARI